MVIGHEPASSKDLPLFIPPRKRQSTKKCNGSHNYVDHIVTVQVRFEFCSSLAAPAHI